MKFSVGILGATGFIGTPYRAEIRNSPDDATIVALCARRRDLLEAAAAEDRAQFVSEDWRAVVEHPAVNLVVVATPNGILIAPREQTQDAQALRPLSDKLA